MRTHIFAGIVLVLFAMGCTGGATDSGAFPDRTAHPSLERAASLITSWQPDAQIIQMGSLTSRKSLALDGMPRGWDIQVASESAKLSTIFTYHSSVDDVRQLNQDMPFDDISQVPYQPIALDAWKIDSDEAFTIAEAAGGAKARAVDPLLDVIYTLHWSPKFEVPMWDINYGSHSDPAFEAEINAVTGEVLEVSFGTEEIKQ